MYIREFILVQQILTAGTTQFIGKDIPVTKVSYNGRGGWVDLILSKDACVYAYTGAIFNFFLILSVEEGTTLLAPKKSQFFQELKKLVQIKGETGQTGAVNAIFIQKWLLILGKTPPKHMECD